MTTTAPRVHKYEDDRNGMNGVALDPMRIRTFIINYDKQPEKQKDDQLVKSALKKQIDEAQKVLDGTNEKKV